LRAKQVLERELTRNPPPLPPTLPLGVLFFREPFKENPFPRFLDQNKSHRGRASHHGYASAKRPAARVDIADSRRAASGRVFQSCCSGVHGHAWPLASAFIRGARFTFRETDASTFLASSRTPGNAGVVASPIAAAIVFTSALQRAAAPGGRGKPTAARRQRRKSRPRFPTFGSSRPPIDSCEISKRPTDGNSRCRVSEINSVRVCKVSAV